MGLVPLLLLTGFSRPETFFEFLNAVRELANLTHERRKLDQRSLDAQRFADLARGVSEVRLPGLGDRFADPGLGPYLRLVGDLDVARQSNLASERAVFSHLRAPQTPDCAAITVFSLMTTLCAIWI